MLKKLDAPLKLQSEQVEPTMVKILATLISRCEAVKDNSAALFCACNTLWYAIKAIDMIAICLRIGVEDNQCQHFSIAASNEKLNVARYIEELTGIDPYKEWD